MANNLEKTNKNALYHSSIENIITIKKHVEDKTTILLNIEGDLHVFIDGELFNLGKEDIIIINPNSSYEAYSKEGTFTCVLNLYLDKLIGNNNLRFKCFSGNDEDKKKYDFIKYSVSRILDNSATYQTEYTTSSMIFDLISYLEANFRSDSNLNIKNQKNIDRMISIQNYIKDNYKNNLSLKDVADHEYLTTSYLSVFFLNTFGKTFLQFYNDIRLDHAVEELTYTDNTVEKIAENSGFSDSRSFVAVFKKKYITTPSKYRKFKKHDKSIVLITEASKEAKDIKANLSILDKYSSLFNKEEAKEFNIPNTEKERTVVNKEVSLLATPRKLVTKINNVIGVPSASDLLLVEVQKQLEEAIKELKFKYVHFHNLFSDEMNICDEDEQGNIEFNFEYIDYIFDYILSIKAKPVVEISFMPRALALNDVKKAFNNSYLISPPKSMKEWKRLVTSFISHIILRYGKEEVESWLFTIWNEPETGSNLFGFEKEETFFEFYVETHKAMRKVLPSLKIGSTTFTMVATESYPYMQHYFDYCFEHDVKFDFIATHYFNDNFCFESDKYVNSIVSYFQEEEDFLKCSYDNTIEFLKRNHLENIPIVNLIWSFTASHRNLISDTCFPSCYIVKNYIDNVEEIDNLSYWSLSDLDSESKHSKNLFHGGIGLFTKNGIPKSSFHSLVLLNKLDDEIVARDDNFLVTKSYKTVHILLHNYVHYSDLFSQGKILIDDNSSRYIPFDMKKNLFLSINLKDINYDRCLVKQYIVNRHCGSSLDTFIKMGGVEPHSQEEIEYIKNMSQPYLNVEEKTVLRNELTFNVELEALEVRLIEIKFY